MNDGPALAESTSFEMIPHQSALIENDVVTLDPVAAQVAHSEAPAPLLLFANALNRLVPPVGPKLVPEPSQQDESMMLPDVLLVTATEAVPPDPNAEYVVPSPFVWSAPL